MSENKEMKKVKEILQQPVVPEKISPENIKKKLDDSLAAEKPRRHVFGKILSVASAAAVCACVAGVAIFDYSRRGNNDAKFSMEVEGIKYAGSYKEIYDYFDIGNPDKQPQLLYEGRVGDVLEEEADLGNNESDGSVSQEFAADKATGAADEAGMVQSSSDYSDTFNQEEGVYESDIVKTDGEKIFYASSAYGHGINVMEVKDGKVLKQETFAKDLENVMRMYLYKDLLITVSPYYGDSGTDYNDAGTIITLYSKKDYTKIGDFRQSGNFTDIRLREDGYLYCVSTDYISYVYDYQRTDTIVEDDILSEDERYTSVKPEDTEFYIPKYSVNGEEQLTSCEDIILSENKEKSDYNSGEYIYISCLDLNSDAPYEPTDKKAIAGTAGQIYCSYNNLYTFFGWDSTEITKFSIGNGQIIPLAGTTVRGRVNDQFSASEYKGNLRIATTFDTVDIFGGSGDENNVVYVLNDKLAEIGKVSNFGRGESIRSVNFQGDMAYVVTFEQTDPLFSIDLSDPKNPVIRDGIEMTGYSTYMQKWGDGQLFGFGEAGDEEGNINGFKMSMFDNSDVDNLKEFDKIEWINNGEAYVYTTGVYDRKALLILPDKNLIGIPVSCMYDMGDNSFKTTKDGEKVVFSKAYTFFSFENNKFKYLGYVGKDIRDYSEDASCLDYERCVIIGDYAYVFSADEMLSARLETSGAPGQGTDTDPSDRFETVDSCKFEVHGEPGYYDYYVD